RHGPLTLAFAITGKADLAPKRETQPEEPAKPGMPPPPKKSDQPEFRMVTVGDSDFASNNVRKFGINSDLFQNMLSWLSKEEDLISIRPRPSDTSEFDITEERSRVINLASIVVLPALMLLSGVGVWQTRRRK